MDDPIRIAILSDLHLNIRRGDLLNAGMDEAGAAAILEAAYRPAIEAARGADLVVLAGDVVEGTAGIDWAARALHCVHRAGGVARDLGFGLNDVVIGRRVLGRMVEIDVRIDGAEAVTVAGDGLIVATASGSTAHALSAGGPLVEPSLDAFVLVPICPHALANRPVVVPKSSRIELFVRPERDGAVVVVDGREPTPVAPGEVVEVGDAQAPLRVVSVSGRSYYDVLRGKLGWKGRPNYRGLDDALPPEAPRATILPRVAKATPPAAKRARPRSGKGSRPA